ncbi:Transposase, Mutator family [Micromonospora halophytica]|uniref:Mutator family transposase n=1 Tax=Micromonospora halophytica TaxID=47864 RepID=A0A1C5IQ05_9ACTN|nr:Transposase, Mutator family [Micromonospora halophytica]
MAERPLDPVYPVIFLDAVHVKIRDGKVANRPIYLALAVTVEGTRDILGLWAGDGGEGAKFWLQVLTELKNRGAADACMVVCDGRKGLPDAIGEVWLEAVVQTTSRQGAPTRIRHRIPSINCRLLHYDGRPGRFGAGSNGSSTAHCTSVRSNRLVTARGVLEVSGRVPTSRARPCRQRNTSGTAASCWPLG